MRRFFLPLLLFLGAAWGQSLSCDATEVRFDFSFPTPLAPVLAPDGQSYDRASRLAYLAFLDTLPSSRRFLPTQVVGGVGTYVTCQVTTPNKGGGGGTLCGAKKDYCLRLSVSGNLPPPLSNDRVYVLGQVVSGNATSHAPTPTSLASLPDRGGLFSIEQNTTATLRIWVFLEFQASDAYAGAYSGSLVFTYTFQKD